MGLEKKTWRENTNVELERIYNMCWDSAMKTKWAEKVRAKPKLYRYIKNSSWGTAITAGDSVTPVIAINKMFDLNTEAAVSTIVHEIGHVCANTKIGHGVNHGREWDACCRDISKQVVKDSNGRYNPVINRLDSASNFGFTNESYPFHIKCPECNFIWNFLKKGRYWDRAEECTCSKCGVHLQKMILPTDAEVARKLGISYKL